jgi:hypothetical protein
MSDPSRLTPLLIVIAGVLALPVTALLVGRYRVAVAGSMSMPGRQVPETSREPAPPRPDLAGGTELLRGATRRQVLVTVGAGAFIGSTYSAFFLAWNELAFTPGRYLVVAILLSWPAVPGVWVTTDGDSRTTLTAAAVYLAALVTVTAAVPGIAITSGLEAWNTFNLIPTVVMVVFLSRTFRAIGVCVLGVALTAVVGAHTVITAAGWTAWPQVLAVLAIALGLSALVGWWAFVQLAHLYARYWFSDHMLLLGSLCLAFCIDYAAQVAAGDPAALAVGFGLFIALSALVTLTYRYVIVAPASPRHLLLLRVFDRASSSRGLLNQVASRWRHLGPVRMIAGPDLAASTVEPDEFLTFVGGHLGRLFIADGDSLEGRLSELGHSPDPDGRYRIEELFCFDTTWKAAVLALLARSDTVLMDLRGLTADRRGALHELEVLGRELALPRTVMIVDERTDMTVLERIVAEAGAGEPQIIHLAAHDSDPRQVLDDLFRRAAPPLPTQ